MRKKPKREQSRAERPPELDDQDDDEPDYDEVDPEGNGQAVPIDRPDRHDQAGKRKHEQSRDDSRRETRVQKAFHRASEKHHATNQAKREVWNEKQLQRLERRVMAFRAALVHCNGNDEDGDVDAFEWLVSDLEPIRVALEHYVRSGLGLLETAKREQWAMPRSPDDLDATTAAMLVVDRGATEFSAVRDVYKVPSAEISDSPERHTVAGAVSRRRASRPK